MQRRSSRLKSSSSEWMVVCRSLARLGAVAGLASSRSVSDSEMLVPAPGGRSSVKRRTARPPPAISMSSGSTSLRTSVASSRAVVRARPQADAAARAARADAPGRARGRQAAQLEHRAEVRPEAQLERQAPGAPGVRAHDDPLHELALVDELALDAHAHGLRREGLAAGQLEVGVRELVQQLRAGVVRAREEARRGAGDRQLVHGEVPAVVEIQPERMLLAGGQAAVALADEERVAELRDERRGEVEG